MTINERVKKVRKSLNLTMEKFGECIGLKKAAISTIESGKCSVTDANIKAICREFNVDYIWLTTGKGEMFLDLPDTLFDELAIDYNLSEEEINVLRNFISLSKEERATVMKFLRPIK